MKNIVITGASRGIGFELIQEFFKDEAVNIFVLTRHTAPVLNLDAAMLKRIKVIEFNITNFDETDLLLKLKIDKVDVLINNAGLLVNKPFLETTSSEWNEVFDTNFFGVARLIKVLFPLLKASGQAHIVNIGSMGGFQGSLKFAGLSAYSSSKGALAILTECLAEEFKQGGYNISCNCLCLGSVNTEMLQQAFPGYTGANSSTEMSRLIQLFAMEGHKFFNGKILPISISTP